MKLRAALHERTAAAATKQGSTNGHADSASAEETVESSIRVHSAQNNSSSNNNISKRLEGSSYQQMGDNNYLLNVEDYGSSLPTYWGVLTGYP